MNHQKTTAFAWKRLLSILLLLSFALSAIACGNNPSNPVESDDTTVAEEDANAIDLSAYTIVIPFAETRSITQATNTLKSKLKENASIELQVKKDDEGKESAKEILIGSTNRGASTALLKSLGDKEYAVVFEGEKIVLLGKDEALTAKAVDLFITKYIDGSSNGKISVAEGDERTVIKLETFSVIKNGKSDYKIIYPTGSHYLQTIGSDMASSFKLYTGTVIFAGNDGNGKGKDTEIIIGNCNRPEVAELMAKLKYNEYGVFVRDEKIYALGWTVTTAGMAASIVESEIKKSYTSSTKTAEFQKNYEVIRSSNVWKLDIPAFDKGNLVTCADAGEDNFLFYYDGIQKADYTDYISKLKSAGYEKVYENEMAQNLFACYRNKAKDTVIYVTYTPTENSVRIVTAPNSQTNFVDAAKQTGYTKIVESSLTQVPVPNLKEAGGQAYIITLEDGSFVLIDGGLNEAGNSNPKRLYDAFQALNKRSDGKIVIAAWVLTHEHGDHYDAFYEFALEYASQLEIECVIYQSPAAEITRTSDSGAHFMSGQFPKMSTAVGGITKVRAHTGQIIQVRNCTIEILYTPEDLYPTELAEFNNASMVTRYTVNGTSFLNVADVLEEGGAVCYNRFKDYLKSDYATVVHHGFWGVGIQMYDYAKPSVVLWPQVKSTAQGLTSSSGSGETSYKRRNYDLIRREYVKSVYYADGEPKTFTFSTK